MQNFATLQRSFFAGDGRFSLAWQGGIQLLKKVSINRWKQLVAALIIFWLAHSLAQLFWLVVSAPATPPASVSLSALAGVTTTPKRNVNITLLKDLTLFGSAEAVAQEVVNETTVQQGPQIEDQAVDTKLKLVLKGVISSSEASLARAIIANAKTQAIYGSGEELPMYKGVKVAKVLDLRVILDNKGQYESLWLYSDDPNAPKVQPVELASRSRVERDVALTPEASSPAGRNAGVRKRPAREIENSRGPETVASLEDAGKKLSDIVAFNIHREDGKVKGYRLRPGRDAAAFEALGLQAGDIVTAVNGEALDNPGKIMQIYRNLGQTTSASLEIERDGSPMSVDIQLD